MYRNLNTHLTLLFNGWYYEKNMNSGNLPEGVILDGLENAAKKYPELVQNIMQELQKQKQMLWWH